MGRPPLQLADMVFACVYMCYTGLASREAATRLRALRADGIVNISCHHNSLTNYMRRLELTVALRNVIDSTLELLPVFPDEDVVKTPFDLTRDYRTKSAVGQINGLLSFVLAYKIWFKVRDGNVSSPRKCG